MKESVKIPVDRVEERAEELTVLFEDMSVPAIYKEIKDCPALTISSEQIELKIDREFIDKEDTCDGYCTFGDVYLGVINDTSFVVLPKFEVTLRETDGCISERALLHELEHVYQKNFEFMEYESDKKIVTAERRVLLRELRKEAKEYDGFEDDFAYESMGVYKSLRDTHDILFYRKSLTLDIAMGYAPGTTFGYGLADAMDYFNRANAERRGEDTA